LTYLPILIDIRNQDVLVVGEGHLAARKARAALRAGARVTLVTAAETPPLTEIIADANCRHLAEPFRENHLRGTRLVFAATEDDDLAKHVSRAAREAGIPINAADRTALCSFIMPATVTRGPIVVAVSTGGDAPILTRSLRAHLESMLPASLGILAGFISERRKQVSDALPDFDSRRRFWDGFMDGPIPERVSDGDLSSAARLFDAAVEKIADPDAAPPAGTVTIVGCGPGDPDLLTFKALRLMQQADVAVVDAGIPDGVSEKVRRDAETVAADLISEQIPDTLIQQWVQWADQGKSVVCLGPGNFPISDAGRRIVATLSSMNIQTIIVEGVAAEG